MKKILIIASVALLLSLIATGAYSYIYKKNLIYFNDASGTTVALKTKIVSTPAEKEKGLGGVQSMGELEAMLFVNEKDSRTPFWMLGMKMPIDMIFLDKDLKIVYIAIHQQPCLDQANCQLTIPTQPYRFVVEVNSGFVIKNQITVGESFGKDWLTFVP